MKRRAMVVLFPLILGLPRMQTIFIPMILLVYFDFGNIQMSPKMYHFTVANNQNQQWLLGAI
jgi:hypothetical protein